MRIACRLFVSSSLALVLLLQWVAPVRAAWPTDPAVNVPLCTMSDDQSFPAMAPDSSGGAIVTWQDGRAGAGCLIYAQRVDAAGVARWAADGVAISAVTNVSYYPAIASDGAGGAIITWQDLRNGNYDIFAQRVNASGSIQWTTWGTTLCSAAGEQSWPDIVADGSGGAIVTWIDFRSGTSKVYAQRVNALGVVQWPANGVALRPGTNKQVSPHLVSDGAGGAVIAWTDYDPAASPIDPNIYAQRVSAAGALQWTASGVALCTAPGYQIMPVIAPDASGGAIVAWQDSRSGATDVYAQRVNSSGIVQWTADGAPLCTLANDQTVTDILPDGAGGAIATWYDSRVDGMDYDIYAQRVNGAALRCGRRMAWCSAPPPTVGSGRRSSRTVWAAPSLPGVTSVAAANTTCTRSG